MSTYTIVNVAPAPRAWESKYGPMLTYLVTLRNAAGKTMDCQLNQKANSPAPTAGQQVDGTVETTDYGPRFKKEQQARGGFQRDSPEQRASIAMQHAQKAAVDIVRMELEHGRDAPISVTDLVMARAQKLWEQVRKAEGK